MNEISQITIKIPVDVDHSLVTGVCDETIRAIETACGGQMLMRGDEITVMVPKSEIGIAQSAVEGLIDSARRGHMLNSAELSNLLEVVREGTFTASELHDDVIHTNHGRVIRPKTSGQKRYTDAMRTHTITFGLGPAGTGKTFLACAMAADMLLRGDVKRIVLCRPIVEAGESLGYLPGTLMEKVDPYNRPLYDALFDMMDAEKANRMLAEGIIQVVPLAFMRGRTFNRCFVILDEAQNATREQMKLFLTRLGSGTKMVITGDESQSDSPKGPTGLLEARRVLSGIDDIAFCELGGSDVIRHELVARIIEAYEKSDGGDRGGRDNR